jgi:hypothetical protein
LVGKAEEKRPFGRLGRRWEDDNKMDLEGTGFGGIDWIELAQNRDRRWAFLRVIMGHRVP